MRASLRHVFGIAILFGAGLPLCSPSARAQQPSLGGYGAMSSGSGSAMSGNVIVPLGGGSAASMGPGMKSAGLSFRPRPTADMSSPRPTLSMDSMGGMSRTGGGMGGRRSFTLQPSTLTSGASLGGGMRRMPGASGMGVMPPNFSYPFRQPGSLLLPSSAGTGMGM